MSRSFYQKKEKRYNEENIQSNNKSIKLVDNVDIEPSNVLKKLSSDYNILYCKKE